MQWIKHSPAMQVARVQTQEPPRFFFAPILTGIPAIYTLSHTRPIVTCSGVFDLSLERIKKRNRGKILAAPSVRQNTNIRAMYGRKK